ncbi:MAG TPA: CocE/NonD family hydrolase [Solirubrobacteraceae bacterium]|nr:CocE/NonD family hydrolase [Solirubrobacteraceae bacterium]
MIAAASLLAPAVARAADTTLSNVTIPASDGVNLVGDVYLPGDGRARYPAVIDMEPYGRSTSTQYVDHGYARVNTDVRGSGMSGGALCLLCLREQQDVVDVVKWIERQPWSNGHVALYGYSYSAITALLGAALHPPGLDAVVVGHPPTDPYRDVIWHNGLYDQGFVDQWFAGQTVAQSIGIGPQAQIVDRAQQQFAVETRLIPLDGPLYDERSVLLRMRQITVPVYIFSGWLDMFSRGDMRLIDGLGSRYKLLYIDPSTHHGTGQAGEVGAPYGGSPSDQVTNSGSLNSSPPDNEDQAWLDRFVKGIPNGIEHKPRVRYFDLGDRTWHSAPSWQSATSRLVPLYLSAQRSGSAPLSPNDGTLAAQTPSGSDSYQDMYVYNPAAGASIPMGTDGPDGFLPYAPLDQRIDQPQGVTYTTPALSEPLPLAGPSEFRFWAITEGSDMAWVGRLIDVAPDGSTSLITQGWLRASFRYVDPARSRPGAPYLPDDRLLPVTIGLPTEYRMDIWDTSYTLAPGHRLRLWLSSSDTPTHEPLAVAGRNLILHSSDYPSQLLLGTRLPGPGCATTTSCASTPPGLLAPSTCYPRTGFDVPLPAGMRRARAFADGRRLRIARRGGGTVALVHPRARDGVVLVRIRGTDGSGRRVSLSRRYLLCGAPAARRSHTRAH